jgi:hypothetical protein
MLGQALITGAADVARNAFIRRFFAIKQVFQATPKPQLFAPGSEYRTMFVKVYPIGGPN